MNDKGETNVVGWLLLAAVGVIVGLALLQASADNVAKSVNTLSFSNVSYVTSVTPNGTVNLVGRDNGALTSVKNATGSTFTSNFTIQNVIDTDGVQKVQLKTGDKAVVEKVNGTTLYITYTANPDGYMDDSSSRAVFGLVLILGALGIAVVTISAVKGASGGLFG